MPEDNEELMMQSEGLPKAAEPRGFSPEQMLACETCLRANAPTRTSCLYCGAALPATEASAGLQRPTLRPLEKWERGYHSILLPPGPLKLFEENVDEMARLLRLEPEDVRRIIEAGEPVPLARVAIPGEASLIESKLGEFGLRVLTISDEDLGFDPSTPKLIRALEFENDSLLVRQPTGIAPSTLQYDEVMLLVAGRIFTRQVEVVERKARSVEQKITNVSETSADEAVLDLYSASGEVWWRIAANNFNFSCLDQRKSLLAAENFLRLVEMLRARSPQAVYDDSYNRVRRAVGVVWRPEQQTESSGLQRGRFGRYGAKSMTTSDNRAQFTRYSRLRYYLKVHGQI